MRGRKRSGSSAHLANRERANPAESRYSFLRPMEMPVGKRRVDWAFGSDARRRAAARAALRRLCPLLLTLLLCLLLLPGPHSARAEDDWDSPRPADKPPQDKPAKDKAGKEKSAKEKPAEDTNAKDKAAEDKAAKDKAAKDSAATDKTEPGTPAGEQTGDEQTGDEQIGDEQAGEGKAGDVKTGDPGAETDTGSDPQAAPEDSDGMFLDIESYDEAAARHEEDKTAAPDSASPKSALRRPRPQSAEQERTWKLNKTREDPFLNPPGGEIGSGLPENLQRYRPADWLSRELPEDYSVYLAQDSKGKLVGSLSLAIQTRSDEDGEPLVVLTRSCDFGMPARTEVLSLLDGLRPRLVQRDAITQPGAPEPQLEGDALDSGLLPVPHLRVEYFYDRVTIIRDAGEVASHERMRALPFSFDIQQLPLVMRLLNYSAKQWPFEAYVTLPEEHSSAPLVIKEAPLQNQLSAEGEKVPCHHVRASIGKHQYEWWVQKAAPHRLIRFSDGELTYTLSEYSRSSRGGY